MRSYRNSDPIPPIMQGSPPPADMRPPLIDWDRAPWNRWAFQHVSEIIPTARILRGATASDLPVASGNLDDFSYTGPDGQQTTFAKMLDATFTDAMFVWKNGKVLHESYHNGMGPRSQHLLQSVSKSVTAAAAGCLVADGLLDPAQPITRYLPELEQTAWKGATLQHVLDMTSGARFTEDYEVPDSDVGIMDVCSGWKTRAPGRRCQWLAHLHVGTDPGPEGERSPAWHALQLSLDRDGCAGPCDGAGQRQAAAPDHFGTDMATDGGSRGCLDDG